MQRSQGLVNMTGSNQTAIGDEQNAPEAKFPRYLTEPFNNSSSEDNARTRLEVERVHFR